MTVKVDVLKELTLTKVPCAWLYFLKFHGLGSLPEQKNFFSDSVKNWYFAPKHLCQPLLCPFGAKKSFLSKMVQKGPDGPKMGPKWSKTFRLTILVPFGPFWTTLECWQACHVWPFLVQNGPFLGHPQSWTVDPRVKKGSSSCLLCVACLWNPKYSLLEHKYGRNQWKMSKIGQNSMKKWPFFAIILPWMARYGSKRSFLLIFSARDDLVKVSWKSDVGKCQNQLTPPYFDQLSERHQPLSVTLKADQTLWSWFSDL